MVEQDLPVAKARLNTLFEGICNIVLHRGRQKDELDLTVLKQIKNLVEHQLLCLLNIVVNVLEDEKDG